MDYAPTTAAVVEIVIDCSERFVDGTAGRGWLVEVEEEETIEESLQSRNICGHCLPILQCSVYFIVNRSNLSKAHVF